MCSEAAAAGGGCGLKGRARCVTLPFHFLAKRRLRRNFGSICKHATATCTHKGQSKAESENRLERPALGRQAWLCAGRPGGCAAVPAARAAPPAPPHPAPRRSGALPRAFTPPRAGAEHPEAAAAVQEPSSGRLRGVWAYPLDRSPLPLAQPHRLLDPVAVVLVRLVVGGVVGRLCHRCSCPVAVRRASSASVTPPTPFVTVVSAILASGCRRDRRASQRPRTSFRKRNGYAGFTVGSLQL